MRNGPAPSGMVPQHHDAITDYGSFGLGHGVNVRNNAIKLGAGFGF